MSMGMGVLLRLLALRQHMRGRECARVVRVSVTMSVVFVAFEFSDGYLCAHDRFHCLEVASGLREELCNSVRIRLTLSGGVVRACEYSCKRMCLERSYERERVVETFHGLAVFQCDMGRLF